jgi:chemotaxis signal transduction protein
MMGALTETAARQTSPVPQEARKRDSSAQYLTFMLSGEVFSIPILPIREIISTAN